MHADRLPFEETTPVVSLWAGDRPAVRADAFWVVRCARRMVELRADLAFDPACEVAHELSLDDRLRSRPPELVAEDMVRDQLWLD